MSEILGRPLTGEITRFRKNNVTQWGVNEFLPMLDAVLDAPEVAGVRWRQYTPYFNDGEPCQFGVGDIYVRIGTDEDCEDGDYDDGFVSSWDMRADKSDWRSDKIKPELLEARSAMKTLEQSMDHFRDFLEDTFGDHAVVTATKNGFNVEFYDHD